MDTFCGSTVKKKQRRTDRSVRASMYAGDGMMATVTKPVASKTKCPVCGSTVSEMDLGRAGVTAEELVVLRRHIKQGTFGLMLRIAEAAMRRINPDKMSEELVIKEALAEFTRTVNGLNERILGPAIGKVGEMMTIQDFKSIATMDTFSDEKASKQGTDIVAIVTEDKTPVGKVAISVKYDNTWKSEFIHQLTKNIGQEGTKFGILVTKAMPSDRLNDKAYVREDKAGNLILVAKPEYAAVAYYGFRQAVIAWNKAQRFVRDAKSQFESHQHVARAVIGWVNGQQFKTVMKKLDEAYNLSNQTDDMANKIKKYIDVQTEHNQLYK